MLKNKKFFIFLLFLFSIIFLFSSNSFASIDYLGKEFPDFPEEFNNSKYKIICYYPNLSRYEIICWNNDGAYFIHSLHEQVDSLYIPDGSKNRFSWYPSDENSCWSPSVPSDGNLELFNSNYFYHWEGWSDSPQADYYKIMIYSNFDINIDNTDEIFFHKTPLLPTTTTQLVIGGNIYQEVKKLLIMILVVLVSLIGLRKGLKMLLTLLHRS